MIRIVLGTLAVVGFAATANAQQTGTAPTVAVPPATTPTPDGALLGGSLTPGVGAIALAVGIGIALIASDGSNGTTTTTTTTSP